MMRTLVVSCLDPIASSSKGLGNSQWVFLVKGFKGKPNLLTGGLKENHFNYSKKRLRSNPIYRLLRAVIY